MQSAHEPLLQSFQELGAVLDRATSLDELDTMIFIKPFLDIVRSEETSGPITGVALAALQKFVGSIICTRRAGNVVCARVVLCVSLTTARSFARTRS